MGVDFSNCDACDEVFCKCDSYSVCDDCGSYLCGSCMEEFEVHHHMAAEPSGEYDEDKCPFCSKQVITDTELLEFALTELKTNKDKLTEKYRQT